MKTTTSELNLTFTDRDQPLLYIPLKLSRREAVTATEPLQEVLARGKLLSVEIKPYRAKRSLDANALLWVMLGEMAAALNTDKDSLYLEMLERYGVFTHIVVKPEVVERVKQEWRTVRELGEVTINGKTGIQLQCYFGSSTYNSKEFSVLLEGVISEAQDLGIETRPEAEINSLLEAWNDTKTKADKRPGSNRSRP